MDQEQLAAGDAAIRGHPNEAALVACRRDEASGDVEAMDSREFNDDFVGEAAAAGTTAVTGARSEHQQPRQASAGNSGPRSGRVRTGATTASAAAAARVRQHEQAGQAPSRSLSLSLLEGCSHDEDPKARDIREFDHYVKMHLQHQQQTQTQTQQLLTRLQQPRSPSSTEGGGGGGEVAPARASLDLELRL